jgi:hypothetical protein
MFGRFTRYGPVQELLTHTDRRLVVLTAGDEMTLTFQAPPPLPRGWVRDFLMYNVGWDKDADLNTVLGQTVEPLPYVGMPAYPYVSSDDGVASDAKWEAYLREYQTRDASRSGFWRSW